MKWGILSAFQIRREVDGVRDTDERLISRLLLLRISRRRGGV